MIKNASAGRPIDVGPCKNSPRSAMDRRATRIFKYRRGHAARRTRTPRSDAGAAAATRVCRVRSDRIQHCCTPRAGSTIENFTSNASQEQTRDDKSAQGTQLHAHHTRPALRCSRRGKKHVFNAEPNGAPPRFRRDSS